MILIATVKLIMQEMNYEVGDSVGKAFATIQHEEEVLKKK
jgi:hypothetical protein